MKLKLDENFGQRWLETRAAHGLQG